MTARTMTGAVVGQMTDQIMTATMIMAEAVVTVTVVTTVRIITAEGAIPLTGSDHQFVPD